GGGTPRLAACGFARQLSREAAAAKRGLHAAYPVSSHAANRTLSGRCDTVTTAILPSPAAVRGVPMARPRILIVEDERGLVQTLSWYFNREGYEVHVAQDGRDGLHKAQTLLPDLVLLDVMLPGLGGLDVCRHLRAGERTKDIPVVMITA